jgi:outer membrane protein assembly factor BamB
MRYPITHNKQTASFRIVGSMLTIAPLWLMLTAANPSAHAQTSDDVSNSSATTATASSPADWTQFLRDNMQRWNPYETVLGVNNVGGLKLKWKYSIRESGSTRVSSPAVVNGVVYVGADDNNVYALNASTGEKLWTYTTGGPVDDSPAVANGVVYVGSDNLYALNATTGKKLWSYPTFGGPPAVVNGVVYIGPAALNAATGEKLWSYPTIGGSPAVANGVVYFDGFDNVSTLYALNASTGSLLWRFFTNPEDSFRSPAVSNGVVYVGTGEDGVYAVDATTLLWDYVFGATVDSTPAIAHGVVYVGTDINLLALNASTGAKLWSYNTGFFDAGSPAVANGVVYIGSADGNVYALNANTGGELWSYDTGTQITSLGGSISSPAVVDGVVYIHAGDQSGGNIYAFSVGADLFLRIWPSPTTVHQGDLLTFAFPVWNLGPNNAFHEVLTTQVPAGTTFDYIRISGTPGLGTCTHPPYQGTGQIVCHENSSMAPNTTWTVRLTVKVKAPSGTVITENAATMADTPDPNLANNTSTVSIKVQ